MGVNVNAHDEGGDSALSWAFARDHLEVIKLLIESGADPNAKDKSGDSPLHTACLPIPAGLEIIMLLIEKDANIDAANNDGRTPLHYDSLEAVKPFMRMMQTLMRKIDLVRHHCIERVTATIVIWIS